MATQTFGANSSGLILGERPADNIPPGVAALDRIRTDAMVDEGDFEYAPPVSMAELRLPAFDDRWPDRSESGLAVTAFYKKAYGRIHMDEAFNVFEGISDFVSRRPTEGHDRRLLFEAPFDRWAESDGLNSFMYDVRDLYGVRTRSHILRNDIETQRDPNGTMVCLARTGGKRFLLVERSHIAVNNIGKPVLMRRLEAADASKPGAVQEVLDEFSVGELIRFKALLASWDVPKDDWKKIMDMANRRTVRNDGDARRLASERYEEPGRRWRQIVSGAVAKLALKVTTPPAWFSRRYEPATAKHRR